MSLALSRGVNDLERVVIEHPSGSRAEVYLNGAHVTSWKTPDGAERLFLSRAANFEEGRAIRGGIPVVFPQFADSGPLVKHGWLRTTVWKIDNALERSENCVRLVTRDTTKTRAMWDYPYNAALSVELDDDTLTVTFEVANTGDEVMRFTTALHSYLSVSDIAQASVLGLYGSPYIDKTAGRRVVTDDDQALRINRETDRIYTGAPWRLELSDDSRRLDVSESGFRDVVVWNPWMEMSREISDLRPDDYLRFICIEAAVADEPHVLNPGERWSGSQKLVAIS